MLREDEDIDDKTEVLYVRLQNLLLSVTEAFFMRLKDTSLKE